MGTPNQPGLDYDSYTLDELRDAHRSLDKQRFPQRADWLQKEIERREAELPPVEYASEATEALGIPAEDFPWFEKQAIAAQISALALVVNKLAALLFGFSVRQLNLALHVDLGSWAPAGVEMVMAWVLYALVLVLLALGGASIFIRSHALHLTLIAAWFLLSIQFRLGSFVWAPELASLFSLSFGFGPEGGGLNHAFVILPLPAILTLLSLVTLPDRAEVG